MGEVNFLSVSNTSCLGEEEDRDEFRTFFEEETVTTGLFEADEVTTIEELTPFWELLPTDELRAFDEDLFLESLDFLLSFFVDSLEVSADLAYDGIPLGSMKVLGRPCLVTLTKLPDGCSATPLDNSWKRCQPVADFGVDDVVDAAQVDGIMTCD